MRTTPRRGKLRVESGSKVDDRDEIEFKILAWPKQPEVELEPVMALVRLRDGSFG